MVNNGNKFKEPDPNKDAAFFKAYFSALDEANANVVKNAEKKKAPAKKAPAKKAPAKK